MAFKIQVNGLIQLMLKHIIYIYAERIHVDVIVYLFNAKPPLLRSKTPLAVVSLSLSLPCDTGCNKQVAAQYR